MISSSIQLYKPFNFHMLFISKDHFSVWEGPMSHTGLSDTPRVPSTDAEVRTATLYGDIVQHPTLTFLCY